MRAPKATEDVQGRACPVCGGRLCEPFADERIDPGRLTSFTYASRKCPEFMCLRLVRCVGCDLVYAPDPPPLGFLSTAYAEAAYDSGVEALDAAQSYAQALSPFMTGRAGSGAALDVGAGSGPFLPRLLAWGFDPVVGIEPSRAAIEAAPAQVRPMLREGMFSRDLVEGLRFSFVSAFMTLEHMVEPGEFVRAVHEILNPGGMVAVVVHDWRAPLNRLLGLRSPIIDVEHMQLFSPESVRVLLGGAGFVSIDVTSFRNRYQLRYWLRLALGRSALARPLLAVLDAVGLADARVSFNVGNMVAVGIKPLVTEVEP